MNTFSELTKSARSHPAYWLEGLNIQFGERLIELKDELDRTCYWNEAKRTRLAGKISELHHCLRAVKMSMEALEK